MDTPTCPACQARSAAQKSAQERLALLPPRQLELVKLVAFGLQNNQISLELNLAERTVRNMTSQIYEVLGVGNRTAAARLVWEAGLL